MNELIIYFITFLMAILGIALVFKSISGSRATGSKVPVPHKWPAPPDDFGDIDYLIAFLHEKVSQQANEFTLSYALTEWLKVPVQHHTTHLQARVNKALLHLSCKRIKRPIYQHPGCWYIPPPKDGIELDLKVEKNECEHPTKDAYHDHVQCLICGSVKTDHDPDWGVAAATWFPNLEAAHFYRDTGDLPKKVQP